MVSLERAWTCAEHRGKAVWMVHKKGPPGAWSWGWVGVICELSSSCCGHGCHASAPLPDSLHSHGVAVDICVSALQMPELEL